MDHDLWVGLAKYAQGTQNNRCGTILGSKYDFLHEDEYQSFLLTDNIVLTGHIQAFPKYPNGKFVTSLQYLKKQGRDEEQWPSS